MLPLSPHYHLLLLLQLQCKMLGLTPAYQREAPQVLGVRTEGHEDEAVQVKTLHQDPVVVGGQEVDEEEHRKLAADLAQDKKKGKIEFYCFCTSISRTLLSAGCLDCDITSSNTDCRLRSAISTGLINSFRHFMA